jgi:redox-sensitive bicupin YhaK (pirin superfamily)
MIIEGRQRDIDGLPLVRTLPSPKRRLVGPFIFFDHVGPAELSPGQGLDVRPHPHINLATVTYLFDGEFTHRDSLGFEQVIRPGAINWMTAGRGIVHSERTPRELRETGSRLHGLQIWVALPKEKEEVEPDFHHHPAETLPTVETEGSVLRVLAGTAFGRTSPVRTLSPLFYVEARLPAGARVPLPADHRDRAAYVVEGAVSCAGERAHRAQMIVLNERAEPTLLAEEPSRVMLLGGEPLDGERHVYWNFVSSSEERIERAKLDWQNGRFPRVPGDETEFIPLPDDA